MFIENKIGPKTEPCGTPQVNGEKSDSILPSLNRRVRSLKYDENLSRAVPLTPTES